MQITTSVISSVTAISVRGEIDAYNGGDVAAHVIDRLSPGDKLLLDMAEVEFIAAAALSLLHDIQMECLEREVNWVLVPSVAVSRLLQICNATATLPVVHTAAAGFGTLGQQDEPARHLRLV